MQPKSKMLKEAPTHSMLQTSARNVAQSLTPRSPSNMAGAAKSHVSHDAAASAEEYPSMRLKFAGEATQDLP